MKQNRTLPNARQILLSGFAVLMICSFAAEVKAQVGVSMELNSRYVWRGFDFGNSPSIMPEVTYTAGGFEAGIWAAYATNGNPAGTEIDYFLSYTFSTDAGDISLSVTDYTFPDEPGSYFDGDAHFIEIGLAYSTSFTEMTSFYVSGNVFVHNDDDNAGYVELGLDFDLSDVGLGLFAGFTPAEAELYETTGFAFINAGVSVSKEFELGDSGRSIGISTALIANPNAERMFAVGGISFGF